jgi:hypothetical protein
VGIRPATEAIDGEALRMQHAAEHLQQERHDCGNGRTTGRPALTQSESQSHREGEGVEPPVPQRKRGARRQHSP